MSSELTSSKAGGHRRGPLLVLGAAGQLGSDLVRAAVAAGVECVGLTHRDLDVTDSATVTTTLKRLRPAVVVNSTSFTNVEECEGDPARAFAVNSLGALHAARAAAEVGARILYISTDYVFPGDKPPPLDGILTPATAYSEGDSLGPCNVYGASKAAGEHSTALAAADHLIVRVSSLFGIEGSRGKGGNFVESIIRKARAGEPLRVVADQWMTPTATADAARAVLQLAFHSATGVVHVANSGGCTWHTLATEVIRTVGGSTEVIPIPTDAFPTRARRPRNSALFTARLAVLLGSPLPPWRDAVATYIRTKWHSTL